LGGKEAKIKREDSLGTKEGYIKKDKDNESDIN
jgi:hypothetical protein